MLLEQQPQLIIGRDIKGYVFLVLLPVEGFSLSLAILPAGSITSLIYLSLKYHHFYWIHCVLSR